MQSHAFWPFACALALAAGPVARGDDPASRAKTVTELAAKIDQHVAAKQKAAGVQPAPVADDGEYLRRVYLLVAGRIPTVYETREFLRDTAPDKRARIVERLLDNPRYVTHFTTVWRNWMLPEARTSLQAGFLVSGFDAWVSGHMAANTPYDKLVHELLTTPVAGGGRRDVAFYAGGRQANPAAYYVGKEIQPENLAASTSRLFLGVRLECAQCHDHPFAKWKKDQFWSYAAFFSGLGRQNQGDFVAPGPDRADRREISIPGTDRKVSAKFPSGAEPKWKPGDATRKTLADWVTAPDNPYFARATVNRMWEYFLGTGLVEPIDEMVGADNVPSHPQLLDELARAFVAEKHDLKFLIRAITASTTFQRTSRSSEKGQEDLRLFARMPVRGMTAEQLYDSVATATGYAENAGNLPGVFGRGGGSPRAEFVSRFADQSGKATEYQTSILQALSLMNGQLVASATSLERSEILSAVIASPFLSREERIETLFLATVTRKPTPKEMSRMVQFIERQNANASEREKKENEALADVFWALLNSSEFVLNH